MLTLSKSSVGAAAAGAFKYISGWFISIIIRTGSNLSQKTIAFVSFYFKEPGGVPLS